MLLHSWRILLDADKPPFLLNDTVELIAAILTFAALIAVIIQIRSAKQWRREDFQEAEKRHREDLDAIQLQAEQMRVIAKNSSEELSVLSKLLTLSHEQGMDEKSRREEEDRLLRQQRKIDVRPYFVHKQSASSETEWQISFENEGKFAKEFTATAISKNVEIQKSEFPFPFGPGQHAKVFGRILGEETSFQSQRETPFAMSLQFEDIDGVKYVQRIDYPRGSYGRPTIGDPIPDVDWTLYNPVVLRK